MVNKAVRTALERLWKDRCSIFIREEVTDPVTHLTDSEEKPLLQDQPCKLSFETLTSTNGDEVATAQQVVKLFLSPDVKVPAGCKIIQHNSTIQFPVVKEGARLTLERKGTPGKLEFTVVKGPGLNFAEGDPVKLTVNGTAMFYGFVFKKKRDKGGTIDVVAYDQLRYLKNKDTITEEGLKASDLLKRIATDFRLNLGTVEDTGYTLETIVEENQTLFDMIQSALDETLMNTKQLYVLYDDAGKLTLKNINTMKLNLLIDEETGENFSYESSIDEQTYNKIKLAYNDEKTGKRELFIAQDGAKMNQWGVLQYFEEVQTKTGASAKADALLKLYDQKTRKLTIQNAFGDVRVRAGSAVVVALNLGDIVTNNYMVVNKVTHTFRGDEHMMELDLIGGEFIA